MLVLFLDSEIFQSNAVNPTNASTYKGWPVKPQKQKQVPCKCVWVRIFSPGRHSPVLSDTWFGGVSSHIWHCGHCVAAVVVTISSERSSFVQRRRLPTNYLFQLQKMAFDHIDFGQKVAFWGNFDLFFASFMFKYVNKICKRLFSLRNCHPLSVTEKISLLVRRGFPYDALQDASGTPTTFSCSHVRAHLRP